MIKAVLTGPDPILEQKAAAWMATRSLKYLRQRRGRLATELAGRWSTEAREPIDETVMAVPFNLDDGMRFKLLGRRDQRVGEFRLPDGPLLMRVEGLRSQAASALARHGVHLAVPDSERPYANAGCRIRADGRWTIHPIMREQLLTEIELGSYIPQEKALRTRFPEFADLLLALIVRHGRMVESVDTSTPPEHLDPVLTMISGHMRQRADLDIDISMLQALLRQSPPVDDWPYEPEPEFDEPPARQLSVAVQAGVPRFVSSTLSARWKATGWWWDLGYEGGWECHFAGERYAHGALSLDVQRVIAGTSATMTLPDHAGQVLEAWATRFPLHAPLAAALELRDLNPDWWQSQLDDAALMATATTWTHTIAGLLEGLPRDETMYAPGPCGIKETLLTYAAASLISLLGPTAQAAVSDEVRDCRICGTPFRCRSLGADAVYHFGQDQFCPLCLEDALNGLLIDQGTDPPWLETAIWAIQAVSSEFGGPPSRDQLQARLLPSTDGMLQVISRMLLPVQGQAIFQAARKTYAWSEWLDLAGVLGEGTRQARGTTVTASDGHRCRSLFERHIDDFLHHHGIPHEIEPYYPVHSELNATGLRADWRLGDGTLVEALGLSGRPDYDVKVTRKVQLADLMSIRLILIYPRDLRRLHDILRAWIHE
ncbi:hypothetical protein DDE18_15815 [Nocardioides gansuensis]|uniref:Uncharacterized protein n=1 Tax=Nocardioides gansuensis TaxID=2138300 RepID=A0A2T8F8T6_9ACTN|nr:hypothetical protein [Nocardioides gansuensis]PVG82141.1 hypothetical protein DDE18_15815 [Nocardioides gansuensis]